jgi:hypothetical protein
MEATVLETLGIVFAWAMLVWWLIRNGRVRNESAGLKLSLPQQSPAAVSEQASAGSV